MSTLLLQTNHARLEALLVHLAPQTTQTLQSNNNTQSPQTTATTFQEPVQILNSPQIDVAAPPENTQMPSNADESTSHKEVEATDNSAPSEREENELHKSADHPTPSSPSSEQATSQPEQSINSSISDESVSSNQESTVLTEETAPLPEQPVIQGTDPAMQ